MKISSLRIVSITVGVAVILAVSGLGCSSKSTSTSSSTTTTPPSTNSAVTPQTFVTALVALAQSGQIDAAYANTTLVKSSSLQPGYFVIFDGKTQTYLAIDADSGTFCQNYGTTCSNVNPNSAALAYVNAVPVAHQITESNGTTSTNGTQISTSYGTSNEDGSYYYANALSGIPLVQSGSSTSQGQAIFNDTYGDGVIYSNSGQNKDVDLVRAQVESQDLQSRAIAVSAQYGMSITGAAQLTQLSDRMQTLTVNGQQMTDEDRAALTEAAFEVAGVSGDDVNAAAATMIKTGDKTAVNDLLEKAATNLGMNSPAMLRDQILPSLGINIGQ
jgi:hypothetical protein